SPSYPGPQPTYINGGPADVMFNQDLISANGLEFDTTQPPGTVGLWLTDLFSSKIILFVNSAAAGQVPNLVPQKVLLKDQPNYTPPPPPNNTYCGEGGVAGLLGDFIDPFTSNPISSWSLCNPTGSVGVDSSGDVYVTVPYNVQDVWRFPAPPLPATGHAPSADVRIFKPRQIGMHNDISTSNMYSCRGVAVAEGTYQGNPYKQIIASDLFRLMYWNVPSGGVQDPSFINGGAANGFLGTDSATYLDWKSPNQLIYGRIREDHSPQPNLWVIQTDNSQPNQTPDVQIYSLPLLTTFPAPIATLTAPLPILGGGTLNWTSNLGYSRLDGIAPYYEQSTNQVYLWLSDQPNSRVFRVRNPYNPPGSTTTPVVDIILGQPDAASTGCNGTGTVDGTGTCSNPVPTRNSLDQPGAIAVDHHGDLYISDHSLEDMGNHRMLRYDLPAIQWHSATNALFTGQVNTETNYGIVRPAFVYGTQGDFNTRNCSSSNGMCRPYEPAFTSTDDVMVVGMDGQHTNEKLPVVFLDPRHTDQPATTLDDYGPQSYADAFDSQDNLYVTENNRGRVLIYYQPFQTQPLTPTPTPTPTPDCFEYATPWMPPVLTGADGLALDMPRYRVYVADPYYGGGTSPGAVRALNYQGAPVAGFGIGGVAALPGAFAVAVGTCAYDGLYVAQRGPQTVTKLNSNGSATGGWTTTLPDGDLRNITVDGSGQVYVAASNSIYILDALTGSQISVLTPTGTGALNEPSGLVMVGNSLYVADSVHQRIMAFSGTNFGTETPVLTGLEAVPYGLAMDLQGHLYAAMSTGYDVFVNNSGTWTSSATGSNSGKVGAP
ncbi:MAG TPA: hypothetical protein VIJ93_05725, partial [bacterium]